MERIYDNVLIEHFAKYKKILIFSGPRQIGKTTIAKNAKKHFDFFVYLNWDNDDDRSAILKGPRYIFETYNLNDIKRQKTLIVFDEIHKYFRWKNFIKGFYDTYSERLKILVTGSAKLDIYRKSGDSLMGRYFLYRVNPISVAECVNLSLRNKEIIAPKKISEKKFNALLKFSGYPEPFLEADRRFYNRWKQLIKQNLFKEDLRDFSRVRDLSRMEILAEILKSQAGQMLNVSTLAVRIQISSHTINDWINILSSFFYCFVIRPWHKNISRSLRKQTKIYLWNWAETENDGARAENFIACHLLKAVHYWTDSGFGDYQLYYLRDKDKREVDFLVTKDKTPWFLVEVKQSDNGSISPHLHYFQKLTCAAHAFQVVIDMPYVDENCFKYHTPVIVPAKTFLSQLV